jgi:hypothetical protein
MGSIIDRHWAHNLDELYSAPAIAASRLHSGQILFTIADCIYLLCRTVVAVRGLTAPRLMKATHKGRGCAD